MKAKILYHENGKVWQAYTVDDNKKKQGSYEEYYQNGQLEIRCSYKDGKKDGLYEEFYENGQLHQKLTYKNGIKEGAAEIYSPDGDCIFKGVYIKDVYSAEDKEATARAGLCNRLKQMERQMSPTQLRQAVKRAEVAQFRSKFPNKKDGR